MTFINTIDPADAPAEVQAMYRQLQGRLDYLPNYAPVFSHRPRVMSAWAALQDTIREELSDREYSLITLAAARAMGSTYCALAHTRKLCRKHFSEEELLAILQEPSSSSLTAAERAMMALADKVVRSPSTVRQEDVDALREQGCSDARVFDVVAAAAARCFFARVPDALGVRADPALGQMNRVLRELLVVGRPIDGGANTVPG
ncbi:carboxymuconolactone decarboxylase family protein [Parahaliea maris]|nr:peroxidase-related enzyme [Parahaliea maris]